MRFPFRLRRPEIPCLLLISALLTGASPAGWRMTPSSESAGPVTARAAKDLTRKQPLLIWPGDPTQMKVAWQLNSTASSTIDWGTDTTYALGSQATAEYGTDHQHAYTITGLTPGWKYFYRVTTAGDPVYKGSFHAAPPSNQSDVKLFVYGDTRTDTAEHDVVAGAMVDDYTADPEYQSIVLCVGDLVADGNSESTWDSEFFDASRSHIRTLTANLPFHSCMGNHEGSGTLFVKYFPYPYQGGRYWSFDYGPLHVTFVDQYNPYGPGSVQHQWITSDLASSNKPWKFIVLHEPGWSGGGHENDLSVQNYIQPLCLQYGVSIVLGGHNHYYTRAVVNDIQHITTGGGGAPLYTPNPDYPYIVAAARAYHYCRIDINNGTLTFQAVTPDGTLLDAFTIQTPVAVEPTIPQTIVASAHPNPFSTSTTIRWSGPAGHPVTVLILDVHGRVIRRFSAAAAGEQSTIWDGTDENGGSVRSGIYYYWIGSAESSQSGKLLRLR
jgi:hypothetical protein